MNSFRIAIATLTMAATIAPALAKDFTMNFDGIPKANTPTEPADKGLAEVLGYYNGDPGAPPVFPRAGNQPWDVTFTAPSLAINSAEAGGPGVFTAAHSGDSAVGSLSDPVRLDLSKGVSLTGLNFWYDKIEGTNPTLQLFSNGEEVFSDLLVFCGEVGLDGFCGWTQYLLKNDVLADLQAKGILVTGIVFAAQRGTSVFDDVSLSTTSGGQPVDEPASLPLAALGLALAAGIARRRAT